MIEDWRAVSEFPTVYEVSTLGRVRRIGRGRSARVGRILATYPSTGYPKVALSVNDHHYRRAVHRLVADAFLNKPVGSNVVNHLDGVRTNNRIDNLEWTTHRGNWEHACRTGLTDHLAMSLKGGRMRPAAKLALYEVEAIRSMGEVSMTERKIIASAFGVTERVLRDIVRGRTWIHE